MSVYIVPSFHDKTYTFLIYREDKTDFEGVNGGKPIPSFICGTKWYQSVDGSSYLPTIELAHEYVREEIARVLDERIEGHKNMLAELKADRKRLKEEGIEAFRIKNSVYD
ncbi:MAG: hypothetical protein M0R32_08395 [Candidatus Cloacimonetes bacterium]|jgi:hypothetical protein|nr:hypothetical protein [Candidatus Cloacimonadota bacterium]